MNRSSINQSFANTTRPIEFQSFGATTVNQSFLNNQGPMINVPTNGYPPNSNFSSSEIQSRQNLPAADQMSFFPNQRPNSNVEPQGSRFFEFTAEVAPTSNQLSTTQKSNLSLAESMVNPTVLSVGPGSVLNKSVNPEDLLQPDREKSFQYQPDKSLSAENNKSISQIPKSVLPEIQKKPTDPKMFENQPVQNALFFDEVNSPKTRKPRVRKPKTAKKVSENSKTDQTINQSELETKEVEPEEVTIDEGDDMPDSASTKATRYSLYFISTEISEKKYLSTKQDS
jgi:hypothetical protein